MRSQFVLRNQAAMEQQTAMPGAPPDGHGHGGHGGRRYGGWPYAASYVVPAISSRYFFNPYAQVRILNAADMFAKDAREPTCEVWRTLTREQKLQRAKGMLLLVDDGSHEEQEVSGFAHLIDTYCSQQGVYGFSGLRPWISVQGPFVQRIPGEATGATGKAPGAIGETDRHRMLNSLTLDEMDTYSYLSPEGRSEYEDRWLVSHPVGSTSSATAYHFAESTMGLASGTIAAVIASNDRAQSQQLAAQTERALADLALRRDAARTPLEMARINLQMETMSQTQRALIAVAQQGGINTQTIVIGAVAAVALLAGAYIIAGQSRKNPVVYRAGSRVFVPMRLLPKHEQRRERKNPSEGETVYQINTHDDDSFGEFTHRASTIEQMERMAKDSRHANRGLHVLKVHNAGKGKLEWEIVAGQGKGEKGVVQR